MTKTVMTIDLRLSIVSWRRGACNHAIGFQADVAEGHREAQRTSSEEAGTFLRLNVACEQVHLRVPQRALQISRNSVDSSIFIYTILIYFVIRSVRISEFAVHEQAALEL